MVGIARQPTARAEHLISSRIAYSADLSFSLRGPSGNFSTRSASRQGPRAMDRDIFRRRFGFRCLRYLAGHAILRNENWLNGVARIFA